MLGMLHAIKFLVFAPFLLMFLTVINLMTSPDHWWVQWAALGLGIAWFINLFKVLRGVILMGGLAALGYWLWRRYGDRVPQAWAPPAEPAPAPSNAPGSQPPQLRLR